MYKKLILNDFKNNRLVTIATVVFMAVSAMMTGVSVLLFGSLLTSIDRLMETAKTPDFLQMHSGAVSEEALYDFAKNNDKVEYLQLCKFLNLENGQLSINEHSLLESTQDNGICIQNEFFDFLVDTDGNIIQVNPGEVYVPVCYKNEYDIMPGDTFFIANEKLVIAGFLRDSQMNSMMASSKRFLVCEQDYERLATHGEEEYLIEFKLKKEADVNAFGAEYANNKLPGNGPTITYSLVKLMNALSDGMMILVILLVSVVLLFISIICIRYILLTSLEKDKKEIGMLKAVGISKKDINRIYISKFLFLSVVSAIIGMILAALISVPMGSQIKQMYGMPKNMMFIYLVSLIGVIMTLLIILASVSNTLKKMRKLSAIQALYGEGRIGNRKNKFTFISVILAAAVALILIPQNMASTLSSPKFVTYMGIGDSQIRIDIRQVEDVTKKQENLIKKLENDKRVEGFVAMKTGSYDAKLQGDNKYKLLIENGDHSKYPVSYSEGTFPVNQNELALSRLNASELNVGLGDTLEINNQKFTICGIYSDITNGGKTAKACIEDDTSVMWSVVYVNLQEKADIEAWVNEYQEPGMKVTDIAGYVAATYGQTIDNINKAAIFSMIAAAVVLFVVVLLFLRMIIWQERGDCSLKKALGLTSKKIKNDYVKRVLIYFVIGLIAGLFLGIVPGEKIAGSLLGSLGAAGFKFIINPLGAFIITPVIVSLVAVLAAKISLLEINKIKAYECCIGKE